MQAFSLISRRLAIVAVLAMIFSTGCTGNIWSVRSDASLFTGSTPADTAIYCGVLDKPYILQITATAPSSPGRFHITFQDFDVFGFEVPLGARHQTTHALGGTPGVDATVKITAEDGVQRITATLEIDTGAADPFDETLDGRPASPYNFCITAPRDPGSTSAARIIP